MALPGSSPRWREVEARFRPPSVLPAFQGIHRLSAPKKPDKVAICERFCADRANFREIRFSRAERNIASFTMPALGPRRWTAREIIERIAEKHGLTPHDLKCDGRIKPLVLARHEACYEIARLTTMSLPAIGKALGGRDHTTIRSGIMRHMADAGMPSIRGLQPLPRRLRPETDPEKRG